jgi:GTPase Era involved in 16S rRNA processing
LAIVLLYVVCVWKDFKDEENIVIRDARYEEQLIFIINKITEVSNEKQ